MVGKKVDKDRKEIKVPVSYYIGSDNFEGSLESIVKYIKEIPEKVKEVYNSGGTNTYLNGIYRYEIDITRDYDGSTDYNLIGYRLETDEELNKRLELNRKASESAKKAAKQAKINREKQELELFTKLQKKYGK